MTLTNIDMIYKALLSGLTVHRDQCSFKLSDVVSDLRAEGFKILYDPALGYWMEIESVMKRELAELQVAAHGGELAEQVSA